MSIENDTKLLYALYSWIFFVTLLLVLMVVGYISEFTACLLLILSAIVILTWGIRLMQDKKIKIAVIIDGNNTFYTDNLKHPKAKDANIITMFEDDYKRIPATLSSYQFNKD